MNRSTEGLREHLFKQLEALDNGNITPQHAMAVAAMTSQIAKLTRLDMEYARFVSSQRGNDTNTMGNVKTLKLA